MRIVAAMSGGVDSSTVAALLVEQGHEVIGVHMKLHDVEAQGPRPGHCCGYDDALDARRVADALSIPFYVMDLRKAFKVSVMDYFSRAYLEGWTPNPCVPCNGVLKFDVLLKRARALGAEALATGHYARILPSGGLQVAIDRDKDQTYFLFPVNPDVLGQVRFPLGTLTKGEVRDHARRLGVLTADKPESQEICFIPDDDHTRFVREQHPDISGAGEIVDESGQVLGRHDGYWRFTVGQRRGLGVAAGYPLYVLEVDPISRQVTVGPPERLHHQGLLASGMNWFRHPGESEPLFARIRHRGALLPCTIHGEDPVRVQFRAPAKAVAPGQAVVFYTGDEVLGGGWIQESVP